MKTALTGIKPTGTFHLGNYLGSVKEAINLANSGYNCYYFIANYHALTAVKNADELKEHTYHILASWLALTGSRTNITIYLQSDISEIFELYWILNCFTSKGLMDRAHSFKDAVSKGHTSINMGLYSYPVLMAADILCFDADFVPVGKDQKQHIEIARDIASQFNNNFKNECLKLPEPLINEKTMTVPGLDGQKMSKSKNNIIPVFAEEKVLKKIINSVVTNSASLEDKKDPNTCTIFSLYKLFASTKEQEVLKQKYLAGGMGWGFAKTTLYEKIVDYFKIPRTEYAKIIKDKAYLDAVLLKGKQKAKAKAALTLDRVRKQIGIN